MSTEIPSTVTDWNERDKLRSKQELHKSFSQRKVLKPHRGKLMADNKGGLIMVQGGTMKANPFTNNNNT